MSDVRTIRAPEGRTATGEGAHPEFAPEADSPSDKGAGAPPPGPAPRSRPPRRRPCGPACGHGFAQAEAASEPHRREAAVPVTAPNPTCNLPHVQKALETGF